MSPKRNISGAFVYLVRKDSIIPATNVIGNAEKNILVARCALEKKCLSPTVSTWKY